MSPTAPSILLITFVCLTIGLSQGADAPPSPIPASPLDPSANAALAWWRAFESIPTEDQTVMKLAAMRNGHLPEAAADAYFKEPSPALDLFGLGAALPYCDWGIDLAKEGPSSPLPHITHCRHLLWLGILRARWHAERHEYAATVDDLLTCMKAARLMSGRHPLAFDFLASARLETLVIETAGAIITRLPSEQRARLGVTLIRLPTITTAADVIDQELAMEQSIINQLLGASAEERSNVLQTLFASWGSQQQEGDSTIALTDDLLKRVLAIAPVEMSRWKAHLRLPPPERLKPLIPAFSSDDRQSNRLLSMLFPNWKVITSPPTRFACCSGTSNCLRPLPTLRLGKLIHHYFPMN